MTRPLMTRSYTIGETITFRSRVALPGTNTPTDPEQVSLISLRLNGGDSILDAPVVFTRLREGEYILVFPTTDLAAGVYDVVVSHSGESGTQVTQAVDHFSLIAL